MKIRTGFVSNSSSSSFVIVASQQTIDKAMATLDDKGKELIQQYVIQRSDKTIINGGEVFVSHGEIQSEEFGCEIYDFDGGDYEKPQEDWDKFMEAVNANGGYADQ